MIYYDSTFDPSNVPDIGDNVGGVVNGQSISGTLICNSAMGLTPVDLFNDILTTESDLQNFLKQNNIKCSTGVPGMVIQAYLAFCQKLGLEFLLPISEPVTLSKNALDQVFEESDSNDEDIDITETEMENDDQDDDDFSDTDVHEGRVEISTVYIYIYAI